MLFLLLPHPCPQREGDRIEATVDEWGAWFTEVFDTRDYVEAQERLAALETDAAE